jgi:hypothetical protein
MTKKRTPNTDALDQLTEAVTRVTGLISRVLAKFPQDTLSASLVPLRNLRGDISFRRSSNGRDIVLDITSPFVWSTQAKARFPVKLLDAPESEVTGWVRAQHWNSLRLAQLHAQQTARADETRARRHVSKAEADLATAKKRLAEFTALAEAPVRPAISKQAARAAKRAAGSTTSEATA